MNNICLLKYGFFLLNDLSYFVYKNENFMLFYDRFYCLGIKKINIIFNKLVFLYFNFYDISINMVLFFLMNIIIEFI